MDHWLLYNYGNCYWNSFSRWAVEIYPKKSKIIIFSFTFFFTIFRCDATTIVLGRIYQVFVEVKEPHGAFWRTLFNSMLITCNYKYTIHMNLALPKSFVLLGI